MLHGCVWYVCSYVEKKGRRLFSSVFAISEMRYMGLYVVVLSVFLLSFGIWTILANFNV